jgi:hypothetical protein
MSHRIDDRLLWLGVGIGLIVAFKGIKYAIEDTIRLTQVKPLGKDQDEELQRQPEDCTPALHPSDKLQANPPHQQSPSTSSAPSSTPPTPTSANAPPTSSSPAARRALVSLQKSKQMQPLLTPTCAAKPASPCDCSAAGVLVATREILFLQACELAGRQEH